MTIQELREKRSASAKEARHLLDNNSQWTDEVNAQYEGLMKDIDDVDAAIAREEAVSGAEAKNAQRVEQKADRLGISTDETISNEEQGKKVFAKWLRNGIGSLDEQERGIFMARRASIQGAMSTTTDSEGGYLAPDGFSDKLIEEVNSFGGMFEAASLFQTADGNNIPWPTVDATSQTGEIVAENTTVARQDVTFGVKNIGAYKYSSKDIAVPFELLQDSRIDLEAYIRKLLAERIARIQNTHFTVGTGTGQPKGIVAGVTEGKVGTTGQTTSIIYDDLVDLEHSIDRFHRQKAKWMLADSSVKVLKKLKDSDGRPLWVPGLTAGEPDTLLRYAYIVNDDMAAMAANAKSLLFGDLGQYLIRQVMQVQLFRMTDSAFTRNGQVGFLAFARADGNLMDAAGASVKYYANSAT